MNTKETLKNYFKLHGFMLDPKATVYILSIVSNLDSDKHNTIIDKLISAITEQQPANNKITVEIIEKVVSICRKDSSSLKLFQVIDSFHIPKLKFNNEKKKFDTILDINLPHFSKLISDNANDKSGILRNRFDIIMERLNRSSVTDVKETLKPIEYLLSCGVTLPNVVVLAMLTQFQEDKWFLEDSGGFIQIDLTNTKYHKGLVVEGSFVLAEGRYEDRVFYVDTIGMPPLEPASTSRNAIMNNSNYFGGLPSNGSVKTCKQIEKIANTELSGKSLVFVSEIWLDQEIVSQKLKVMFHGYTPSKPGAFIFCGDFLSPSTRDLGYSEKLQMLKQAMRNVIKSFAMFPELALNSHLIFVPGPNDLFLGSRNILPRASLPAKFLLENAFDSLPGLTQSDCADLKTRVILTSNPCRITFYNKEIVVFRESIVQTLYQHCLFVPAEEDHMEESQMLDDSLLDTSHSTIMDNSVSNSEYQNGRQAFFLESQLVWTILSQAHLLPVPIHVTPTWWGLDHALQLFPAPDLLVLSDPAGSSFDIEMNDCIAINPPNFSSGENFPFKIYYPFKGEIQSCNLII